jgi:N-acyl-D-aspartate/D-glutamate deacylase
MDDLIIRNGTVVDGSGMPGFVADVAVRDGKIRAIGHSNGVGAERVIDADGLVVSPGFIDHHTHYDAQFLWDPYGASSCWHGVTTTITGNCSLTLFPCKPGDREALIGSLVRVEAISRKALEAGLTWNWQSTSDYLNVLSQRLGINVACLVGHSAIRQWVLGEESSERTSTDAEVAQMRDLLRDALRAGAIGFSTNQSPAHSREDGRRIPSGLASDEELVALAGVFREFNTGALEINYGNLGITYDFDRGFRLFKGLAAASRRPIAWISIQHRWQKPEIWKQALVAVEQSFREGYQTYGLTSAREHVFRFSLKNAQLFDTMPNWKPLFADPDLARRAAALRDPGVRARLRYDAVEDPTPSDFSKRWDLVYLYEAGTEKNRALEGKSVAEIAKLRGQEVLDAFLDLSLEEDLETVFKTNMIQGDPEAVAEILKSPYVLIGISDAGAHTVFDAGYGYCTELLGRWVREKGLMRLEEAVNRLTFVPASIYGLYDRGLLRPGMAADITLFDPRTVGPGEPRLVHDYPAGEGRLDQPAYGIIGTIVNGQVATWEGRPTGALPGRVLKNAWAEPAR